MDGVIWTLKETVFAIVNEFGGFLEGARSDFIEQSDRSDRGCGDVILCQNLVCGNEILSQGKEPPRSLFVKTDAQQASDEFIPVKSQLIGRLTVHRIHAEELFPIQAPIGPVSSFNDQDQVLHPLRNGFEPIIESVRIESVGWGKKLDHGAERTVGVQNCTVPQVVLFSDQGNDPSNPGRSLLCKSQILFPLPRVDRPTDDRIGQRF